MFTPLILFDTPTPSPTGGVKSSYTYPDKVYAILSDSAILYVLLVSVLADCLNQYLVYVKLHCSAC